MLEGFVRRPYVSSQSKGVPQRCFPKEHCCRRRSTLFGPLFLRISRRKQTGGICWGNDDAGYVGEETIFFKQTIGKQENLIVCTDQGKAYPVAIADLPYQEQRDKPQLADLLPDHAQRDNHQPINQFILPENFEELDLLLLTTKGKIKRLAGRELGSFTSRGLSLIKLKDQDTLQYAFFVGVNDVR